MPLPALQGSHSSGSERGAARPQCLAKTHTAQSPTQPAPGARGGVQPPARPPHAEAASRRASVRRVTRPRSRPRCSASPSRWAAKPGLQEEGGCPCLFLSPYFFFFKGGGLETDQVRVPTRSQTRTCGHPRLRGTGCCSAGRREVSSQSRSLAPRHRGDSLAVRGKGSPRSKSLAPFCTTDPLGGRPTETSAKGPPGRRGPGRGGAPERGRRSPRTGPPLLSETRPGVPKRSARRRGLTPVHPDGRLQLRSGDRQHDPDHEPFFPQSLQQPHVCQDGWVLFTCLPFFLLQLRSLNPGGVRTLSTVPLNMQQSKSNCYL